MAKKSKKKKKCSKENIWVDKLLQKNIKKLIELGHFDANKKNPYGRTDGERILASFLSRMKLRYIPEFYTGKLKGDTKAYRLADFYLPTLDIYVEHLGGWNRCEEEKRRYRYKMAVYAQNNMNCVYIFPGNLNSITYILKKRIKEIEDKRKQAQKPLKLLACCS